MAVPMKQEMISTNTDLWSDSDDEQLLELLDTYEAQTNASTSTSDVKTHNSTQSPSTATPSTTADSNVLAPLEQFRRGYLWVSDLTRQNWCERQLYYTFTIPAIVEENPVMTEGSNLHLARELAVHDVVEVSVTSSEDIWAIKVLNMINSIQGFLNGQTLMREIPIFGAPFDEDVFVVGLIDELRFDPETYTISLQELKTRKYKSNPSKAQKEQHRLQVMLYKKLFDDLVKGKLSKETVSKHLNLKLNSKFGESVQKQIAGSLLACDNLDSLMECLFQKMQGLTCVNDISIEYVLQETKETLFHEEVFYSEADLQYIFKVSLPFWRGQRSAVGVDIEDAWKCQMCDFASVCDWRQRKSEEYSKLNQLRCKQKTPH